MSRRAVYCALFAMALGGCSTSAPLDYTVSRDTLFYLQQLTPTRVAIGAIEGKGDGGDLAPTFPLICSRSREDGGTLITEYVRSALIKELTTAGLYAEEQPQVRIDGTLEAVRLGRKLPFGAVWTLAMTLTSSNGRNLNVSEELVFDVGSLAGPTPCNRASENLEPAVRALLARALSSPDFSPLLLAPPTASIRRQD